MWEMIEKMLERFHKKHYFPHEIETIFIKKYSYLKPRLWHLGQFVDYPLKQAF